jgi:hypothetical protein
MVATTVNTPVNAQHKLEMSSTSAYSYTKARSINTKVAIIVIIKIVRLILFLSKYRDKYKVFPLSSLEFET